MSLVWFETFSFCYCYQYWILMGTFFRYPVVNLSHGDPVALGLHHPPFTYVTAISTDPGCGRAMNADMVVGGSRLDNTMSSGFSYLPVLHLSPVPPLSTVHESLGFAFPRISPPKTSSFPSLHHIFAHRSGACL